MISFIVGLIWSFLFFCSQISNWPIKLVSEFGVENSSFHVTHRSSVSTYLNLNLLKSTGNGFSFAFPNKSKHTQLHQSNHREKQCSIEIPA